MEYLHFGGEIYSLLFHFVKGGVGFITFNRNIDVTVRRGEKKTIENYIVDSLGNLLFYFFATRLRMTMIYFCPFFLYRFSADLIFSMNHENEFSFYFLRSVFFYIVIPYFVIGFIPLGRPPIPGVVRQLGKGGQYIENQIIKPDL